MVLREENCAQREMRAGNDGGYRLDFHIQSFVITDEKKKRKKLLFFFLFFFFFRCVEEEPKRRLCPEAQSLSLIAFQHTHTRHDFFWAIGGWVSFALEATSLLENKKEDEKVVFIPVFFFVILIEPSF